MTVSNFNPRNTHWEPLIESWEIDANVLHKTAAAVADGARSPLSAEYAGLTCMACAHGMRVLSRV